MTAVARVLPRHWDGHRLLRFLAGLAMLALAFTTPAAPEAPVTVSSSVTVSAETPASVTVSESAPAPSAVRVPAVPAPAPTVAIIALVSLAVLVGVSPRIRGKRAPPAI